MKILITGAAGFVGFHLSKLLLEKGYKVSGIDNINDYYDVELKNDRLKQLKDYPNFKFTKMDLVDKNEINNLFVKLKPQVVINLAAQAGVRYSIENPNAYVDSNLVGFVNILEACRKHPIKHLLYASSSSVYGGNSKVPFSENDMVDNPVSLYAASKKANELMAHTYSHLYGIPTTGLRFFTVYGPWGRPDMAYFSFTKKIIAGETINVFNHGQMERDFTYIDDIVESIYRLIDAVPKSGEKQENLTFEKAPCEVYNIGNNNPEKLGEFINILEEKIGKVADKNYMDMQDGDVVRTYADVSKLNKTIGYKPTTTLEKGLGKFVAWYKEYYKVEE